MPRPRCRRHQIRNGVGHLPHVLQDEVKAVILLRSILPALAWAACFGAAAEGNPIQVMIDTAIREKVARVTIPPGTYRVAPSRTRPGGHESPHLLIHGARNLEVAASGVRVVCTTMEEAVIIDDCSDLVLQGLTVDYDPLPFTQGRIIAMAEDYAWMDVAVDAGYPVLQQSRMQFIIDGKTGIFKAGTWKIKDQVSVLRPGIIRLQRNGARDANNTSVGDGVVLSNGPGDPE